MSIAVWDANTGKQILAPEHASYISSAAFSPDSRHVIYNGDQGLRIVDVTSGQTVKEFPFMSAYSVAYRADGEQILVAGDKTIRLVEPDSDRVLAEMTDTRGEINAAVFTPDGRYIISGSSGGVRVWDAETHQAIGDLNGGSEYIADIGTSSDGRRIVTDNLPGGGVWPGPAEWPDLLCSKLTQNMSDQQWNEWVDPSIPYQPACPGLPKAG
jgi:WD40 repeat protein